jgi:hypothetical protein
MNFNVTDVIDELKLLRRGYGIESPDLASRIGPALRALCGVEPSDDPATLRRKVGLVLSTLSGDLPADFGRLTRVALGLDELVAGRYQQRVRFLADELDRVQRTAQRRIDDGLLRMAELALDNQHRAGQATPWHTARLQAWVMLDLPGVEVLETRRIVAHQAGVREIDNSVTVTPPPDWDGSLDPAKLGVDIVRGGTLVAPRLLGPNRLGYGLRLPRPLRQGEATEFTLRMRVTCPFAPHYVCTPTYPCDEFDLTVRFGLDRIPARVWLLDNVFPLELADEWPQRTSVEPDSCGEVRAEFTGLEQHRSYGLRWA